MNDILEQLDDLIKQATEDRSHYYVRSVAEAARAEIEMLRSKVDYGPKFTVSLLPGSRSRAADLIIENPTQKAIEATVSYDEL